MKCQCLQDDEQSDPLHTTEQFCGTRDETGALFGCPDPKGCGQCNDPDTKKCNNGCPVLNTPAQPHTNSTPTPSKKKPPTKSFPWLWIGIGGGVLVLFIVIVIMIMMSRKANTPSFNSN